MFTQEQLDALLEQHPTLNTEFYTNEYSTKEKLERVRLQLCNSLSNVNKIAQWIAKHYRKSDKFINRSSYSIKHDAEKEIGYVTNGEFIAATLLLGYEIAKPQGNVFFNFEPNPISYNNEFIIALRSKKRRGYTKLFLDDVLHDVRENQHLLNNTWDDWNEYFSYKPVWVHDTFKYIRCEYAREMKSKCTQSSQVPEH